LPTETITIPARRGKAAFVDKGACLRVIDTPVSEVVDTWAFSANKLTEFMAMEHSRPYLMAAGGSYRYGLLGVIGYHYSRTDNLTSVMRELGVREPETPVLLNLFMNRPRTEEGTLTWAEPVSKWGDYAEFEAQLDFIIPCLTWPQDILPINDTVGEPTEARLMTL
jgi:uncharacterized protein YcgI (DUF1989 family)